jgi:hypothetical protein
MNWGRILVILLISVRIRLTLRRILATTVIWGVAVYDFGQDSCYSADSGSDCYDFGLDSYDYCDLGCDFLCVGEDYCDSADFGLDSCDVGPGFL